MRNYIILNGVSSETIPGLLISTLPPISKPKVRTSVEEIDGRDGDIVTKLGYSSYDKEIEIGLHDIFDINQVIAFFNGEGTIVFSNEDDKYYKYQILEQIDYEKLIRYKKAKVRMHVQPFKYPLEETPVEIAYQYVNNEAEEMDLDNTADAPMTMALKGNTSQEGTPTPDTPVEVSVVTGDNTIKVEGKNLFSGWTKGKGIRAATGEIIDNTTGAISDYIPVNFNTNPIYYVSGLDVNLTSFIAAYNSSKQFLGRTGGLARESGLLASNSFTSGTPQGTGDIAYLIIYQYKQASDTGTIDDLDTMPTQLELGNQATSYEPYQSQSYPINLGELELCKIGNYQDYFYKENGKWYKYGAIGKKQVLSTDTISYSQTTNLFYDQDFNNLYNSDIIPICNYFMGSSSVANNNGANTKPNNTVCFRNGTTDRLYIIKRDTTVLQELEDWLDTVNVYVYYGLATPTTTEITDNDLIIQLEAINNARSYDTTTHITQNANKKPFILNASALKKGTDTGVVNNIGNIYSKPTIDIEGTGTIGVYLEENQIFSVDLSSSNECVIDTTNLEAYDPETNDLMNRKVVGNYNNFTLEPGENNIKITGNASKVTITDYIRWL